jgi:hypothetical protein
MIIYDIQKPSKCCEQLMMHVKRHVVSDRQPSQGSVILSKSALTPEITTYKAMSHAYGVRHLYNVKRVGLLGSNTAIGQMAQSIGSYALPGDISPIRSPIRSAAFSALTPGMPGIPGGRPRKSNRVARCPEGYQYGGRFANNELSNCGAQLFDLPSPLGLAIGALRRIARAANALTPPTLVGSPVTPGQYTDILDSRRPQIPRVSNLNAPAKLQAITKLVADMGAPDINATRLVRRDGFVLQPVVSARVLRSIPDNRDMEDAAYLMTAGDLPSLGGEELGLLSNTGVTRLTYVLPGGSTLSLEKVRPLTIGERRKLGRTVNAASTIDNTENPIARLQKVVSETGDGIKYTESFKNVDNPHQVVPGRNGKNTEKWVKELFGKPSKVSKAPERPSASNAAIGTKITSVDEAVSHINSGGSLADIPPSLLAEALKQVDLFKKIQARNGLNRVYGPDNHSYWMKDSAGNFEAINAVFQSDMQQHLGLESPDVFPVGTGDKRSYLYQTSNVVYPGVSPDKEKTVNDVNEKDMAKLFVSDFVSANTNRSPASIDVVSSAEEYKPVSNVFETELTPLAEIKVREQTKKVIDGFKAAQGDGIYGDYYKKLKASQRRLFLREIQKMLERARLFNFTNYRSRLTSGGELTAGEKAHIDIVQKIQKNRLEILSSTIENLNEILGG